MRRFVAGLIVGSLVTAVGTAIGGDEGKHERRTRNLDDRVDSLEAGMQASILMIAANSQRIAALEKIVSRHHQDQDPFAINPKPGFWPDQPFTDPGDWPFGNDPTLRPSSP